jgi:ABC-type lipoprotein release transport system permease subunit
MIIPKLAVRNMLGAGAKTWLNAAVLSMAFVAIIAAQGLYHGFDVQVSKAMTEAEYGGGQYWADGYDPYDLLSVLDAHAVPAPPIASMIEAGRAAPVLIVQGTIYPQGKIVPVLLKGIDPGQTILNLPSASLAVPGAELPALIGSRMAKAAGLAPGDTVTVRWRDARGVFDARDLQIVKIMSTTVQSIDEGQIWLPLPTLREMAAMPGEATIVVAARDSAPAAPAAGWSYNGLDVLLKDVHALIQGKTVGASIMYTILIFLAMLAVFNTQLLSIWRRRREIGTMMAMGATRGRIIGLFTFEGSLNGVFAALAGALWGVPLLSYLASHGLSFGRDQGDAWGFAIDSKMYPVYTLGLVLGTAVLVFAITTIVSFIPTRKIAKLKPTDALRGKMS